MYFKIINHERDIWTSTTFDFAPRIGDTIKVGALHLRVITVVLEADDGTMSASPHSASIYVVPSDSSINMVPCESLANQEDMTELDFASFTEQMSGPVRSVYDDRGILTVRIPRFLC
jgi:hypothetical protein